MEEEMEGYGDIDDNEELDEEALAAFLNGAFADYVERELASPYSELSKLYERTVLPYTLSDCFMKSVKSLANSKGPLSGDDVYFLSMMAGRDEDGNHPFKDIGYEDDCGATDEQLEKYAEFLRNYLYTYKEEAADIDPRIDPKEEHVGPMAQDIEKVAPDCVKETPEGVKTVDGERLALVNAGVIGELARRVLDLEEKIGRV